MCDLIENVEKVKIPCSGIALNFSVTRTLSGLVSAAALFLYAGEKLCPSEKLKNFQL